MERIYADDDARPESLKGGTVAVIGYGSQGRAHALNLARQRGRRDRRAPAPTAGPDARQAPTGSRSFLRPRRRGARAWFAF